MLRFLTLCKRLFYVQFNPNKEEKFSFKQRNVNLCRSVLFMIDFYKRDKYYS